MSVPLVTWPLWLQIVVSAAVWGSWSAVAGLLAWALPVARFAADGPLTRLRRFETGGRFYERTLRIKTWKDRLPEAGNAFPGGFSKRDLGGPDPARGGGGVPRSEFLERFRAETRRAEFTHWLIPAAWPLFFAWSDWRLAAGVGLGLVVANGPCLVIQRYNRARLGKILDRSGR